MRRWPFELAHFMALVPLAWLALLRSHGQRRGAAWWWLATAFAVSWLADTAAHWVDPWQVSVVYPVSQAALVGAVFLSRTDALRLLAALVCVGWFAAIRPHRPDVLLHVVAWVAVVGVVYDRWALGTLRVALFVYFGGGALAWIGYAAWPGWASWIVYQGTRAAGIALFCVAATRPAPTLRVLRTP